MRHHWQAWILALSTLLAHPALAQQEAVHWHHDLESAKIVAKETNRLLLIHFWTPSCGPCLALERNVFNQPGVATAVEAQFVPVKLNADDNSATAQWYGISRVPTDVIAASDGQVLGKMVSPPTPSAYVAEVSAMANKYATRSGQAYAAAAGSAPLQSQLNAAYAQLPVAANAPMAVAAQVPGPAQNTGPGVSTGSASRVAVAATNTVTSADPFSSTTPSFPTVAAPTSPIRPAVGPPASNGVPAMPVAQTVPIAAPPAPGIAPAFAAPPTPQVIANPALAGVPATPSAPPITPVSQPPIAPPAMTPSLVANPYSAPTTPQPTPIPQSAPQVPTYAAQAPAPAASMLTAPSANPPNFVPTSTTPTTIPSIPSTVITGATVPSQSTGVVPDTRMLPPGSPPLAFEGYCPVSMRNSWKWIAGNSQYGIVHLGRTYWFAGPEEQKQFWTDPSRYAPALSGNDPVLAIDHQQQVPGKREHSLDYDGLFYMFASEATLQQFAVNPAKYAAGVRQAMGLPRGRLVR